MKNTPLIIYQTEDGTIKIETHFSPISKIGSNSEKSPKLSGNNLFITF
jgi:hypothetical protein